MISPRRHGHARIDGLELYYEVYGSGSPLVLLHGGLGSIEMVTPVVQNLAHDRQIIALDLQGHGRTADADRPLRFETMADDVAAAIDHLGVGPSDVMGYSLGAGVALQFAIRHAANIRRLVLVSFPFRRSGWHREVAAGMSRIGIGTAEAMSGHPLHRIYTQIAPRPADWRRLHVKLGELLVQDYDWSEDIGEVKAATLLVGGDADSISPGHMAEFFDLLGGGRQDGGWDRANVGSSRLAILPGATHYDILTHPVFSDVLETFLKHP